jgi:hypothetical protein
VTQNRHDEQKACFLHPTLMQIKDAAATPRDFRQEAESRKSKLGAHGRGKSFQPIRRFEQPIN